MNKFMLMAILPLTFLLGACGGHHEHEKEGKGKFVVTNPLKTDTTITKNYVCQIRAIQHIELRTLEEGYLQNIYVDEGQSVRKGQLLFQLMPVVYQAEAKKAEAKLAFAEIEYQNTKSLADSNIVSRNELALAKAKLDKAKADLELAHAELGFTQIRAPFDGIIGRFNDVRLGSLLDEGELLTTLSDNSKMWVYFNVPEAIYLDYISTHKSGQYGSVELQLANNLMFESEGKIETIEADFNNETGNIAFRATFENKDSILRHGETGNVLMTTPVKDALLIPQKATFEVLDKKYVYVLNDKNEATAKEINVLYELPHIYVIGDVIGTTDKVLVEGIRKVKNGDTVSDTLVAFDSVIGEMKHLKAE